MHTAEARTRAPRGSVHRSGDVDVDVVVVVVGVAVAVAVGGDGADDVDGVKDAGEVAEDGEQHADPELQLPGKANRATGL